ncbi:MAG TPA: aspartate aminotransferase family protein [Vicinamibacterales bacterium]|nr:aspartate aminotransferase family protein [Vicinamibacterales bacterium]
MTHVIHRHLHSMPPTAVGGEGMVLRDADGRDYIDACGGAAVSCLGHNHPDVRAAMHAQIDALAYAHTSFFTTQPAEALADQLARTAPPGVDRVYFVSGGSEAIEAALKLARQYFVEIGEPERSVFIARRQSYHGNTLGALAVGGNEPRRAVYAPLLIEVTHVSPCYAYRDQAPGELPEAYAARLAAEVEATIQACGPKRVIAFVAETVGGATQGATTSPPGYYRAVREICDRHGVLLILDEVMSGMGRTGTLHACEQEGIVPDLMTIAKGLGGGFQPIGAVLARGELVSAISAGSGFFKHGHTYLGHAVACAAGLAVQQVIERDGLLLNVQLKGRSFERLMREQFANHPHVGDIRGRGLFWAVELVQDRGTKAPFDPAAKLHARVKRECMARGLMTYPMPGTIDGRRGDHILLAPPFIVEDSHLELIVDRMHGAIDAAIASLD